MILYCSTIIKQKKQPISWQIFAWYKGIDKIVQIVAIIFEIFFLLSCFFPSVIAYRLVYHSCSLLVSLYLLIIVFIWFLVYLTRWCYVFMYYIKLIYSNSQIVYPDQPAYYNAFMVINSIVLMMFLGFIVLFYILRSCKIAVNKSILIFMIIAGSFACFNICKHLLEVYEYLYSSVSLDVLDRLDNKVIWIFIILQRISKNINAQSIILFTNKMTWLFIMMTGQIIITELLQHYYSRHNKQDRQYCLFCTNKEYIKHMTLQMGRGGNIVNTATSGHESSDQFSYNRMICVFLLMILRILQPALVLQWQTLQTQWGQVSNYYIKNSDASGEDTDKLHA